MKEVTQHAILITEREVQESDLFPIGAMWFRVHLGEARNVEEVARVIGEELLFPYDAANLDAALGMMSDLDWFGSEVGYILEFVGLDSLLSEAPLLFTQFISMLPYLCDRWRSRRIPFYLVLQGQRATRQLLRSTIDAANAEIVEASRHPWLSDVRPAEVLEVDD